MSGEVSFIFNLGLNKSKHGVNMSSLEIWTSKVINDESTAYRKKRLSDGCIFGTGAPLPSHSKHLNLDS